MRYFTAYRVPKTIILAAIYRYRIILLYMVNCLEKKKVTITIWDVLRT